MQTRGGRRRFRWDARRRRRRRASGAARAPRRARGQIPEVLPRALHAHRVRRLRTRAEDGHAAYWPTPSKRRGTWLPTDGVSVAGEVRQARSRGWRPRGPGGNRGGNAAPIEATAAAAGPESFSAPSWPGHGGNDSWSRRVRSSRRVRTPGVPPPGPDADRSAGAATTAGASFAAGVGGLDARNVYIRRSSAVTPVVGEVELGEEHLELPRREGRGRCPRRG